MRHCPQYINARKDNDSTPLHVAVTNHHCDVVSLLASHVSKQSYTVYVDFTTNHIFM